MIYKYFSFDPFIKYELYFSSPSQFNDPFESKPVITGLSTLKERQAYVDSYLDREYSHLTYKKRKDLRKSLLIRLFDLETVKNDVHDRINNYGVFCSSEKWSQCLMWSHYTKSHKGFCLGFEFDKEFDSDMGEAHKINYSKTYPELSPEIFINNSRERNLLLLEATLATKSNEWQYESEIRYIKMASEGGYGTYKFDRNKLKEVTIGANAKLSDKKELTDIISQHTPWIDVYQARTSPTEYKLHREKL